MPVTIFIIRTRLKTDDYGDGKQRKVKVKKDERYFQTFSD